MFPTVKRLFVRQSYTIGTRINLCQQTRAHRLDGLCGLVQSSCSILPFCYLNRTLARRPTLFYQRFEGRRRIEKCPVCVSVCVFGACGKGQLRLTIGPPRIPQQALLRLVPRKAAQAWRPEEVISCTL